MAIDRRWERVTTTLVGRLPRTHTITTRTQWCGPCQILAGELDKVAGLYGGKLRVLKVDSDEEPRIASALKVYGLPTIFFIKVRHCRIPLTGTMHIIICMLGGLP